MYSIIYRTDVCARAFAVARSLYYTGEDRGNLLAVLVGIYTYVCVYGGTGVDDGAGGESGDGGVVVVVVVRTTVSSLRAATRRRGAVGSLRGAGLTRR